MPLKHLKVAFPVEKMLVSRKLVNYRRLYPEGTAPFLRTRPVLPSRKSSDSQIPIESPLQSGYSETIRLITFGNANQLSKSNV